MLEKLRESWGGKLYECTKHDRPKSKRIWSWRLYDRGLMELLQRTHPFMVTKGDKARQMLKTGLTSV